MDANKIYLPGCYRLDRAGKSAPLNGGFFSFRRLYTGAGLRAGIVLD